MAVHEPNREWFEHKSGRGKIQIEFATGETFTFIVERES